MARREEVWAEPSGEILAGVTGMTHFFKMCLEQRLDGLHP